MGGDRLDVAENGFNTRRRTMPKPVVAALKSEGFRWVPLCNMRRFV
jgi:hypothetical protein